MPVTDDLFKPPPGAHVPPSVEDGEDDPPGTLYAVPNRPFVYLFYPHAPGSWAAEKIDTGPEEDQGVWWLCHPVKLPRIPGIEGQRSEDPADPGASTEIARMRTRKDGGIWFDARAPYNYVAALPCKHPKTRAPGVHHVEVFATPIPKRRDEKPAWRYDRQRYLRFLLAVHRAGLVPPPSAEVVDLHVARVAERLERAVSATELKPAVQAKVIERHEAATAKLEAAQVVDEEAPPAPAPRPRRARATKEA